MRLIIKQIWEKIKSTFQKYQKNIFLYLFIFFISFSSFLLGKISEFYTKNQNIYLKKENLNHLEYYASKRGKYYYLPWCYHGSPKNLIIFKTKEEAERAGYQPSKYCDGL